MKIYLVGGAVRDGLLQLPIKEKDYVVVGATIEEMIRLGFKPVGKDFPVFLHPKTKEEYALARTERKVGKGYKGFVFNAVPEVTLEEDLRRRDLTINAMAKKEESGELIDPYDGQKDIENKILRHVSPAFAEDPVRILRVARFASRFGDFTLAEETAELMKQMVAAGEVDALVAERVWKEFERALTEKNPEKFFEILRACGAMSVLFPYSLDVAMLSKAAKKSNDPQVRFAALCNSLSDNELLTLCDRYRVPSDYRDLALLVVRYKDKYQNISVKDMAALFKSLDAYRREERFKKFLLVCAICFGESDDLGVLEQGFQSAKKVTVKDIGEDVKNMRGEEISKKLEDRRLGVLKLIQIARKEKIKISKEK